jgi:hypothetical protein
MKHFLFLLLTLCALSPLFSEKLQDRFMRAEEGDFIVTEQQGTLSLLMIRSLTGERLILEEVSAPKHLVQLKKVKWQEWLNHKAPGHTSWTVNEIDLKAGKLLESFSYSKKGWLTLDGSDSLLTQLLTLPLSPLPKERRKRIGAEPASGESDRRALWNPPIVFDGKKKSKAEVEVFEARWPRDSSRLSECAIELYFDAKEPRFAFPQWMEIKSPHYTFKWHTIDAGHHLTSPYGDSIPRRSIVITEAQRKELLSTKKL